MPYPSPADEERNGGCGPILAAVVLLFLVLAAASCASQAMGAQRSRPVWSGFFLSDEQYERPPNDEHAYVFAY